MSFVVIPLRTIIATASNASTSVLTQEQYVQLHLWASIALALVLCGALGNIFTLIVIFRAKWYATGIQVLILTLTICGVATTSVVYPVSIVGTVVADASLWLVPGVCPTVGYVFYSLTCMIPTTCAMIAINRFCIIVIPRQTRCITRKSGGVIMSVVACISSLVIFALPLFQLDGGFGLIVPLNICMWLQWTASQELQSGFVLLIYVIPGAVIALCYIAIFFAMRVGTLVESVPDHGRQRAASGTERSLHRLVQATKMMGMTFVVYIMCYLPLNLMAWANVDLYVAPYSTIYAWLLLLYFTSDCVHPVIYAAMNQDFRKAYVELLCPGQGPRTTTSPSSGTIPARVRSSVCRPQQFDSVHADLVVTTATLTSDRAGNQRQNDYWL